MLRRNGRPPPTEAQGQQLPWRVRRCSARVRKRTSDWAPAYGHDQWRSWHLAGDRRRTRGHAAAGSAPVRSAPPPRPTARYPVPHGRRLLSGAADDTLRLWDAESSVSRALTLTRSPSLPTAGACCRARGQDFRLWDVESGDYVGQGFLGTGGFRPRVADVHRHDPHCRARRRRSQLLGWRRGRTPVMPDGSTWQLSLQRTGNAAEPGQRQRPWPPFRVVSRRLTVVGGTCRSFSKAGANDN